MYVAHETQIPVVSLLFKRVYKDLVLLQVSLREDNSNKKKEIRY